MMFNNSISRLVRSAALLLVFSPLAIQAQDFPTKPIRLIAASGPGSGLDLNSRIIAQGMTKALGQPIVVETMPGASGVVATRAVVRTAPDGYTILVMANNNSIAGLFLKDAGYDIQKDLAPISIVSEVPVILFSNSNAPWKSLKEMADWAKANPGKLNGAVAAPNDLYALVHHLIGQRLGFDITNIAYKTGGAAMEQAIRTNEVHFAVMGESSVRLAYDGNWGRALAITAKQRSPRYPEAVTFEEIGIPEVSNGIIMMFGVAGTPRPVIQRLSTAVKQAVDDPETAQRFAKITYSGVGTGPEPLTRYLATQVTTYSAVAQKAGIKPE